MGHLKMLKLLSYLTITGALFCSCKVDGIGCLSSQNPMDQPSASVATVRSFKESARNSTVIFPALQFSCSGIVTHVNMSFVNRTELCSMMRGNFSGTTTFHIQLSVWETIGQDYRYLGEHRVGVAVKEVIRQCDLQQQSASVTVQFTLDSQLLVQPGYTIGFHYPFVYSFSTVEARIDQVFGGVTPKSLSIEFVEATSAVAILTKRSEITLNTIVTVEQSQFNIAPKVGFSIDVSSVGVSGSITSPSILQDHVAILSVTLLVGFCMATNVVLLCTVLICVSKKLQSNQKNGGPHEYTYPHFSLPKSRHSRQAPLPPPRPQITIGPQEDYEYISSTPPDHTITHLEESNTYI